VLRNVLTGPKDSISIMYLGGRGHIVADLLPASGWRKGRRLQLASCRFVPWRRVEIMGQVEAQSISRGTVVCFERYLAGSAVVDDGFLWEMLLHAIV
jgi:hypothetical protein